MGERPETAPAQLVRRHIEALGRLPYDSLFFDRTARIDLQLVENGVPELANELALVATREPGHTARADLAPVGDEPANRRQVLVVGLLDPELRVLARAAPVEASPPAPAGRLRGHYTALSITWKLCIEAGMLENGQM